MDVGFIGLGNMGVAIARNLLKSGHRLVVYNRTRSKAEALAAEGARVADRPSEACRGDAVFTMLADDAAVEEVMFGPDGIIAALGPQTVDISMSTISVALCERLVDAHARANRTYVAAPVFGRPQAAAAAKLFIVAAGPAAAIARCETLFDAIGQKRFEIGPEQPMANLVKLTGNFLIASTLESMGEAVALVRKSGMDAHRFLDIMTGSLFQAPLYETYASIIADEKYEPAGFKMSLGLKDIRLALAAADAKAVPMPVASLVRDHFLAGVAQGNGDMDWSGLARLSAREAGLGDH
jgi:3-hydroxyisobutyrate dehydrogenase-like beta-hydroxyacid dehydrogenase